MDQISVVNSAAFLVGEPQGVWVGGLVGGVTDTVRMSIQIAQGKCSSASSAFLGCS